MGAQGAVRKMVAGAELAAETRLDVVADAVPEAPVVSVQQQTLFCEEFLGTEHSPYNEEIVRSHLPLVRQVVQRMLPRKPPEVPAEDLISWGTLGLLDAMRKFDANREASFSTYAQYRIKGTILDYLRRCDWLPRSMRQRAHEIDSAVARLEGEHGRAPVDEEIAAELGLSMQEYNRATTDLSTQPPIATGDLAFGRGEEMLTEDDVLSDASEAGPMKKALRKERVEILAEAIEKLPEKERIVVSCYYFEGLTMREMAEILSLTEGRISQLHSQAMGRMRGLLADCQEEIRLGEG